MVMGLLTSLALALIPMSMRSPPPTWTDELQREVNELKGRVSVLEADSARWEALASRWQARYEEAIQPIARTRAIYEAQAMAQMQNARMAQQAPLGLAYQNQAAQNAFYCNCVPARHDAFLGGHGA